MIGSGTVSGPSLSEAVGNPAEAHQMLGRRGNDKVPIPKWSPA